MHCFELIQAAIGGDVIAYRKLGWRVIRGFKKNGIENLSDQEELAQEILLKLAKLFTNEPPCIPEKTCAFLKEMIANQANTFRRHWQAKKRPKEELNDAAGELPTSRFDPESQAFACEVIRRLPWCERLAIEGLVRGESIRETAARVAIPEGTLKRCRDRGLKIVRALFGIGDDQ